MKRLFVGIIFVTLIPQILISFDINGELKFSDLWYIFPEKWELSKDNFHLLDLYTIKESEDESTRLKVRFQVRIKDRNSVSSAGDLSTMEKIMSYEIIPWEIWAQFNDIPLNNLSIKIGKQYFEWGTADGIHPTSVLNPDDYTNPFSMNEKIPVNALNINYTYESIKLFLIWMPSFTPVKLPEYFSLFDKSMYQLPGIELLNINENVIIPPQKNEGMGKALKLNFSLLNIDFSIGYFQGYDYMPEVNEISYVPVTNNIYNLDIKMFFPKMQVYTFDLTTSIEGFGFWVEIGVYDYDKIYTSVITPMGIEKQKLFDGDPYASYIIGTDYTFENGFYFNLQYSYGLPYLRGKDNLEDYFILTLKDDFLQGLMEFEFANILGWNREYAIKDKNEVMLFQKLSLKPIEDLIFSLLFIEIDAKKDMLFYNWSQYDSAGLEISYTF